MPVYTVHAPVAGGADAAATDRFVFVRDGFHFWAAVAIDPQAAGEVPSTKGRLGG